MKSWIDRHVLVALSFLALFCVVSCGKKAPEEYLASGKAFLAKGDSKAAAIEFKNALEKAPTLDEARFLLGKSLLDVGDAAGAQLELSKLLQTGYPSESLLPVLFDAQIALGQFDKVIEKAPRVVLASDDSRAIVGSKLAYAYLLKGDSALAKAAAQKVLALRPDNPDANVIVARLMGGGGELAGARRLVDSILVKNPAHAETLAFKAALLGADNKPEAAAEALGQVLESRPRLVHIHAQRVFLLLQIRNIAEARKQLGAMRTVAPNHPLTLLSSATVAFVEGDLPKAGESAQMLLKITRDNSQALQLAGAIDYKMGKNVQAENNLKRSLALAPDVLTTRRWLALTYLGMGQTADAAAVLQPILDKIDGDAAMLALAGETFLYLGDAKKAEFFLSKAAKLDDSDIQKKTVLAIARFAKGETEAALIELANIASADKGTGANRVIVLALTERRDFAGALKANEELIRKAPNDPGNHYFHGQIQLELKDIVAARKSFEQALTLNPKFFGATERLATLDMQSNRPEEAKRRFEASVAADAGNWRAMLALAEVLMRTKGSADEIESLYKKAALAGKNELPPQLALIAFNLVKGRASAAIALAQEALTAFPDNPEAVAALGRSQQAAGEYNQAVVTLAKLVVLLPKSPMPHIRLAELHLANKNPSAAAQSFRNALQLSTGFLDAQRGLVSAEIAAGRPKAAQDVVREIQAQRPKEAIGYLIEGDMAAAGKAWEAAATAYRTGLKQVPGSTELALKLHTVLFEVKRAAEAGALVASWIKTYPQDLTFRRAVADIAALRGDAAMAATQYRSLLGTRLESPELLNNLAMAASQTGDRSALEFAEKANKLAPDQPAYMETLAVILSDAGDTARALELLKAASAKAPRILEIRLSLARVLIKAEKKQEARSELEGLLKLDESRRVRKDVERMLQML